MKIIQNDLSLNITKYNLEKLYQNELKKTKTQLYDKLYLEKNFEHVYLVNMTHNLRTLNWTDLEPSFVVLRDLDVLDGSGMFQQNQWQHMQLKMWAECSKVLLIHGPYQSSSPYLDPG